MTTEDKEVTAFYNGACPVCRYEMTTYDTVAGREGISFAACDVAANPARAEALGITADQALRRLHATDNSGRLYRGFDAMLLVWDKMPKTRWLARLFGNRLTKVPSAWLYEHVVAFTLYHWAKRRMRRAS